MSVITISREFGSGGEAVARLVAEKLGFRLVNKQTVIEGLAEFGFAGSGPAYDETAGAGMEEPDRREYIAALHDYIYDLAIRNNLVILGRGGHILFEDFPPALHVRVTAPLEARLRRVAAQHGLGEKTARRLIREQDARRQRYYKEVFGRSWTDLRGYDLVVSTGRMDLEEAAGVIIAGFHLHAAERLVAGSPAFEEQTPPSADILPASTAAGIAFMHPSEEEFARLLDFYRIRWEYEPRTFLLEWDSEGNVLEAFTPDFYLPEHDLYVELTTQRQKLVGKKKKKIRRLQELYPEVNVKALYSRDFKSLLEKFSGGKT